jgi:hypothetical protein
MQVRLWHAATGKREGAADALTPLAGQHARGVGFEPVRLMGHDHRNGVAYARNVTSKDNIGRTVLSWAVERRNNEWQYGRLGERKMEIKQ